MKRNPVNLVTYRVCRQSGSTETAARLAQVAADLGIGTSDWKLPVVVRRACGSRHPRDAGEWSFVLSDSEGKEIFGSQQSGGEVVSAHRENRTAKCRNDRLHNWEVTVEEERQEKNDYRESAAEATAEDPEPGHIRAMRDLRKSTEVLIGIKDAQDGTPRSLDLQFNLWSCLKSATELLDHVPPAFWDKQWSELAKDVEAAIGYLSEVSEYARNLTETESE